MLLSVLLPELEHDLSTVCMRHRSQRASEIVRDWMTKHPNEQLPEETQWEVALLDMVAVPRKPHPGESITRFRPLMESKSGETYPDVDNLMSNDRAIYYFKKRAIETANPIQRARYADFVWEAMRSQRTQDVFQFGILAAKAYIEVADLGVKQSAYIEMADALARATEIALQLNNRDVGQQIIAFIPDALQRISAEEEYRWVLEVGRIVLWYLDSKLADLVVVDTLERAKDACINSIDYYQSRPQRNLSILNAFMNLCGSLSQKLGDGEASWTWQVAIAESLEEEAHRREIGQGPEGGGLAAFKFAEEALHLYQRLVTWAPHDAGRQQMKAKNEELKVEVRRLIRQAESEMKHVSIPLDTPREVLDELVAPFFQVDPERVFQMLTVAPFLLPDVDLLRQEAIAAAEEPALFSLIGETSLRDGRKVDEIAPFETESVHLRLRLSIWFQTQMQLLDFVFHRLKEAGLFNTERFLEHMHDWPLIDERDLAFIKVALQRYFAEDYVSAVHVLAPRIERMLKGAFERVGLPTVAVPSIHRIKEQTLGDFLRREDVRQALEEPIWNYLEYALVDERGFNLRNDIAHGWIHPLGCNRVTAEVLFFIILLLTRLHVTEPADDTPKSDANDEIADDKPHPAQE